LFLRKSDFCLDPNHGYYFGGFSMAYDTAGDIKRTRSYSVCVVVICDLLRAPWLFLDWSRSWFDTELNTSCRQSDKASNFLRSLCRSHSGVVPLASGRDANACGSCGLMAYPTKSGFEMTCAKSRHPYPDRYDMSPFKDPSKNPDCDFLSGVLCHDPMNQ
jgi:hypothetical protein